MCKFRLTRRWLKLLYSVDHSLPAEAAPRAASTELYDSWQQLDRLTQQVSDTLVVAGNEAYTAALVVYKAAKDYGRGAELDNFVDEMGKRFWRKSSPAPTPPVEG